MQPGRGALASSGWAPFAIAQGAAKVVIVGGGAGGATVAHYVKKDAPELDVTLIEANPIYSSSFFSNLYLGGFRTLESLNHAYDGLRALGVKVVHDTATDVDTAKKTVKTRGGRSYSYDRLVLSPGIDIKYDLHRRLLARGVAASCRTPTRPRRAASASSSGSSQAMRDGGTVVMVMPNNPYRCPPGPYERACMIAHYLKTKKPKSKLVILDPKKAFSKQPVFTEAFDKYYKDIIELNLTNEIDDFAVVSVDAKTKEIVTKAGKKVKADVANIIPAAARRRDRRQGRLHARATGARSMPRTSPRRRCKDVYVLGDAAIAAEMPKSAFSANSQAKVVAADILAELAKKERFPARYRNTCWSLLAPDDSVKIGANYAPKDGKLDPSGGFVSQTGEAADVRKQNYQESIGWYAAIIADMFAQAGGRPQPRSAKKAG